jgi:hypothetical protein
MATALATGLVTFSPLGKYERSACLDARVLGAVLSLPYLDRRFAAWLEGVFRHPSPGERVR